MQPQAIDGRSASAHTVLVTGGCGFIGVSLSAELSRRGFSVTAIDNLSSPRSDHRATLAEVGVEVKVADVRDERQMVEVIGSVQPRVIVHLAALHFIPDCVADPSATIETNVVGVNNVLSAASAAGVDRVLFTSTADVYAAASSPSVEDGPTHPENIYGATKLVGEVLLRAWAREAGRGRRTTSARVFNVVGPKATHPHIVPTICDHVRRAEPLRLGNLTSERDFVDVVDVCNALGDLVCLDLPVDVVNIGTGAATSVSDLVRLAGTILGQRLVVERDETKVRALDRPTLVADTNRLRSVLPGFKPAGLDMALSRIFEAEGLLG